MFDTHWRVVEKMRTSGLVSDQPIEGRGQCGYADLNAGGFYFLLKDRNKVAEHLRESGYDKAFLALVAYDEDKVKDCVYFHRDYHVRRQGVTALGNL
ncbi:MAG: hypothetical protein ABH814_03560 [bacterium]